MYVILILLFKKNDKTLFFLQIITQYYFRVLILIRLVNPLYLPTNEMCLNLLNLKTN